MIFYKELVYWKIIGLINICFDFLSMPKGLGFNKGIPIA